MTTRAPRTEPRAAKSDAGGYSAKDLAVLEGLEAVRKRPGMYIGSNDGRGLMHCLWEIVDNAVDEALAGHCKRIEVILRPDGSAEVTDDGRGIPVDVEPKTKLTGVEVVLTKLHAGGKFGGGSYQASGGLHGVGASVVNALSSRLDVEVDRGGKIHTMSFRRGVPGVFDGDDETAPFTRRGGLQIVGKCPRTKTRDPRPLVGGPPGVHQGRRLRPEALRERAMQSTYLVPGLIISLRDERNPDDVWEESYQHKGGISEYVEYLSTGEAVTSVIRLTGTGHFHETVPVLDDKGHMTPQEVERALAVDIALRWDTGYDTASGRS